MRLPASKTAALHRNVAHRAACLALYRRLLKHAQKTSTLTLPSTSTESSPTPLPPSQLRQSIKSIITREFKKRGNRDTAIVELRAALTLGYRAEKCLRLATAVPPDPLELARLSAFLNLYRQRRENPPLVRMQAANITVQPTPKPKAPKHINPNLLLLPFDLRFKPTIIGGNTIPFVRYTGTKQPPKLSGILNKKLKQKLKRDDLWEQLKWEKEYANAEDVFDNEIWNEAGREWRKENPDENPMMDGYWKTEVTKAQMELQVKLWAHQVSVWERSGRCMDRIEEHKRRVKEFMTNLKAERAKEKGRGEDGAGKVVAAEEKSDISDLNVRTVESAREPKVEESEKEYPDSVDSQMDALNAQLEAAGLKPDPRVGTEPDSDDVDAQMEALNAQLEAAGFNPTSRISKPRKSSRGNDFERRDYNNFESRDYDRRSNNFEPRDPNNRKRRTDTRQSSHSRLRYDNYDNKPPREPRSRHNDYDNKRSPRESKPRSKRQPSPKRHESEPHNRQKDRGEKENKRSQRPDNGAMLAGKGKRSRRGLDIGKVFGSEEPVSPADAATKSRPYRKALDDLINEPWRSKGPPFR